MSFITYSSNKYHVKSPGLLVSPLLIKPLGLCAADSILEVIQFTTKDFKSVPLVQGKALSSLVCSYRDNAQSASTLIHSFSFLLFSFFLTLIPSTKLLFHFFKMNYCLKYLLVTFMTYLWVEFLTDNYNGV